MILSRLEPTLVRSNMNLALFTLCLHQWTCTQLCTATLALLSSLRRTRTSQKLAKIIKKSHPHLYSKPSAFAQNHSHHFHVWTQEHLCKIGYTHAHRILFYKNGFLTFSRMLTQNRSKHLLDKSEPFLYQNKFRPSISIRVEGYKSLAAISLKGDFFDLGKSFGRGV